MSVANQLYLKIFTWNIEGYARNKFNLQQLVKTEQPSFIFLSEPWLHLADAPLATDQITCSYSYFLNSEDRHDPLLSLQKSRAHGGTMALWHNDLDPYVTVLDPSSSRILALVLDKPGYQVSVHITIYLATAGKDPEFIGDLAELEDTIDIISEKYPNSIVYVRGDANSSPSIRPSNKRDELLVFFINNNNFKHLQIGHKTYHHFMNNGQSDSAIDVLLSAEISSAGFFNQQFECLLDVFCSKTCPWIDSSHDLIMSSLTMDPIVSPHSSVGNITAPRVTTDKHKIVWSTEGISNYQELLNNSLQDLQSEYSGQLLSGSASVLLQATNHILTAAAKYTNKAVFLSAAKKARKPFTPPAIKAANKDKLIAHKNLLSVSRNPASSASQKETAEAR